MTIKDVEDLAELAKLELNQEEKEQILKDMDGILDYIKQIEEVDVPDMEMNYDVYNVWREDETKVVGDATLELIQEQFPDSQNGFVKVKKII